MSISSTVQNGSNPDYVNTRLEEHPWFVGEMDRDCANQKLAPYPIYTFLVKGHPLMQGFSNFFGWRPLNFSEKSRNPQGILRPS